MSNLSRPLQNKAKVANTNTLFAPLSKYNNFYPFGGNGSAVTAIALIFEKTSTRTRTSFEVAGRDLGMGVTYLDPGSSQMGTTNSLVTTSDREKKNTIVYDMDERYDTLWSLLKPCTGKFNNGTSDRTHMFLISQDVEAAIEEAGLTSQDFAAFIKSPKEDEDGNIIEGYDYALRYEEFIPLCIRQIHKLQNRVAELELKTV